MSSTAENTAPVEARATTDYHWVMTVQASGARMNTRGAVVTVPSGYTREKLFAFVLKQFEDDFGTPITVLFFDAQPNQL